VGKTRVAKALLGELGFEHLEVTPATLPPTRFDEGRREVFQIHTAARRLAEADCAITRQHFERAIESVTPSGDRGRDDASNRGFL